MKINFNPGILLLILLLTIGFTNSCRAEDELATDEPAQVEPEDKKPVYSYSIPTEGNSWIVGGNVSNEQVIGAGGIKNWKSEQTKIRTWFKTDRVGEISVALSAKTISGKATINITCGNKTEIVNIENSTFRNIEVGTFKIENPGYQFIEIEGVEKAGDFFPSIETVLIGGEAILGEVYFAHDDFYWARRGPSVHLNFEVPENAGDVQYFYNEITVPENNDVLGSYFMANGFGQGYFGMQVNSPAERRILFSVWSPYETDNPGEIPEEFKITLLKKGEDVFTGEFGNEGSGGQSYFKFLWKAGTTYKFLLKGNPAENDETDFTAWFFAPEVNEWKLIASWRRPKTNAYLTHLYSFLENFHTETGDITRMGKYSNQWIYSTKGEWIELTKIKFTADATARKKSRMDYSGGVENGSFYLKNCGFSSQTTPIDSWFERESTGNFPVINFEELP